MTDARDAGDANEPEPDPDPGIGAVPTWDWRAGTDFGSSPTTAWAPQPIDTSSPDAWPTTTWAAPTTSWATPTPAPAPVAEDAVAEAPSVQQRVVDDPPPSAPEAREPPAVESPAPASAPALAPTPRTEPSEPAPPPAWLTAGRVGDDARPPTTSSTRFEPVLLEPQREAPARSDAPDVPAWRSAGRVEQPPTPTEMPRTIRLARRALWGAMGLAVVGVGITTVTQLVAAASIDVAPSSSWLRNLAGTAVYVGIAAASAAAARRRRSAAIGIAALLAFVSFTGMAFLTIAPLPAAIAALVLLLVPTSRAWLTIHSRRFRRLTGEE